MIPARLLFILLSLLTVCAAAMKKDDADDSGIDEASRVLLSIHQPKEIISQTTRSMRKKSNKLWSSSPTRKKIRPEKQHYSITCQMCRKRLLCTSTCAAKAITNLIPSLIKHKLYTHLTDEKKQTAALLVSGEHIPKERGKLTWICTDKISKKGCGLKIRASNRAQLESRVFAHLFATAAHNFEVYSQTRAYITTALHTESKVIV